MKVKADVRLSGLVAGECFVSGRSKTVKKKMSDGKVLTVSKKGKISTRTPKGDPKVRKTACPLPYIGAGMRKHPETVVEIGDGRPSHIIRVVLR